MIPVLFLKVQLSEHVVVVPESMKLHTFLNQAG